MKTLLKTGISILTVMSLSIGNASPVLAFSISGESIKSSTTVQRATTQKQPLIDGFAIKVYGGTVNPIKAKKGIKVTASAAASPTGKSFTGWTSNCDLAFEDPKAKSTTFIMPEHAVIIQAHFEDILPPSTSSNRIVANSYRNTFEIGKDALSAKQKSDGTAIASIILSTQMNKGGNVQAQLVDADLQACIATGKTFIEKSKLKSTLQVEVKLPVTPEYTQIVMKLPKTTWNILQTEDVSSFSIASKEATFVFNQSAISAMNAQNKADSKLIFSKQDPSTPSERTIYKFKMIYEGQSGTADDIGNFVMPASGISAIIPYEIENEKNASKVSIMGVNAENVSVKASGASYNTKQESISFPIGSYVYYSVGIQ